MIKTRKDIDEMFSDPKLLNYKVICYKCNELPPSCNCEDKWFRLHKFHGDLAFARIFVCLGGACSKDRKMVDKHGL